MENSYCRMNNIVFPRWANNQRREEEERGGEGEGEKGGEKKEESENQKIVVSPQRYHCLLFSNILSFSSIVF